MGFQLENISRTKTNTANTPSGISDLLQKEITLFGKAFSNKVKEDFYTELSVLLKAGINLKEGLELLRNAQKKKTLQVILDCLGDKIVSGQSFSEAIKSEKDFTDYEYHSLKIGEETGTLELVTEQLGSFYFKKNQQRRNITNALTYPVIILSTAVLVVIFMLHYVVPMFQDIFRQQKVELPGITKWIISCSNFVQSYGWLFLILLVGLILFRSLLFKQEGFKRFYDQALLKIPFVGKFLKQVYLAQFTQAVSLLTRSKVPLVNSIQLVKEMINFHPLKLALEQVEKDILLGKSLSESLTHQSFFDDKMVAMVKVAEETNQNEFIFERLSQQYSSQVDQQSKMLSTVMEPFIIMIVGLLVGVILIAMYLPMFKLSSVLG